MSQWFSGDVVANEIKLHYHRTGGDKPPLALAHGFTDNGLCWTRVAQVLEKDYDVIMYDARGHGLSDAPKEGYSSQEHAADLAGLIQALGLKEPRLMGHSMGATTVAATVANYPELARCAVLVDPPWFASLAAPTAEERAVMTKQWRADVIAMQSRTREEIMALCRTQNPSWAEIECGPWADAKLQLRLDVFQDSAPPRTPWQDLVSGITCPTLLITGDPELGAIITPEVAQEAAALWRNGRVAHVSGAGHNIRREQFEKYIEAVTAFLGEV